MARFIPYLCKSDCSRYVLGTRGPVLITDKSEWGFITFLVGETNLQIDKYKLLDILFSDKIYKEDEKNECEKNDT